MAEALQAARLADPVAHSHALGGFLAGAVVGVVAAVAATVVIGAAVAALEVATAGLATPLVIGVAATALEFGANVYVGTKVTEWAGAEGERIGSESMGAPSGQIAQGSANVLINGRPAARAADAETCDAGMVAQGSDTVRINGQPAARVSDKTSCGGQIIAGSRNVLIGGPRAAVGTIQPEVPEWVRWGVAIASALPAIGQAGRAIGPILAEVRAVGLVRAAQTGAKTVARVMEQRGSRALARAGSLERAPTSAAPRAAPRSSPEPVPARAAPAVAAERPLGLPEPTPSRYPFGAEPPTPSGGKQAIDFSAKRPGLDMDNLSPADDAAAAALDRNGWDPKAQEQILNSGRDFEVVPGKKDGPMYKFSSAGRDEAGSAPSPYYTDEAGFRELSAKYHDPATGTWDSPGIKNELALPCYNSADAVWKGTLDADQPLVRSTINPAGETVTLTNADGSAASVFQRAMSGGGTQIATRSGGVVGLTPHVGGAP